MARGDHIAVPRWNGCYTHHGIDMGDGTVVHFSGEPLRLRDACVVREPMDVFCQGAKPRVVPHAKARRSAEEVVEAALAQLGQRGYHLWANNCEHFAAWCKTGKAESRQVRRVVKAAAVTAAGTVFAVGIHLVRRRVRAGA